LKLIAGLKIFAETLRNALQGCQLAPSCDILRRVMVSISHGMNLNLVATDDWFLLYVVEGIKLIRLGISLFRGITGIPAFAQGLLMRREPPCIKAQTSRGGS